MQQNNRNKHKYDFVLVLMILTLFVNIGVILFLTIKLSANNQKIKRLEELNELHIRTTKNSTDFLLREYKTNGKIIDLKDIFFDKDNNECTLSNLVNSGKKIIFRYFKSSCLSCITEAISIFSKYCNGDNMEKCVVLSDINNPINIKYFIRNTNINCTILSNKTLSLNNSCEDLEVPYCFVLDSNLKVSMSFIIRNNNLELFEKYLSFALNKIN